MIIGTKIGHNQHKSKCRPGQRKSDLFCRSCCTRAVLVCCDSGFPTLIVQEMVRPVESPQKVLRRAAYTIPSKFFRSNPDRHGSGKHILNLRRRLVGFLSRIVEHHFLTRRLDWFSTPPIPTGLSHRVSLFLLQFFSAVISFVLRQSLPNGKDEMWSAAWLINQIAFFYCFVDVLINPGRRAIPG